MLLEGKAQKNGEPEADFSFTTEYLNKVNTLK
jgi:hypothetical protein